MNLQQLTEVDFEITSAIIKSIPEGYIPNISYIDIRLNAERLNSIKIMMGPSTTVADKIIVESLLQNFDNAIIVDGFFRGKIKDK